MLEEVEGVAPVGQPRVLGEAEARQEQAGRGPHAHAQLFDARALVFDDGVLDHRFGGCLRILGPHRKGEGASTRDEPNDELHTSDFRPPASCHALQLDTSTPA